MCGVLFLFPWVSLCYQISHLSEAEFQVQITSHPQRSISKFFQQAVILTERSSLHTHIYAHRRRRQSCTGLTKLELSGTSRQPQSAKPTGAEARAKCPLGLGEMEGSAWGSMLALGRALPALPEQLLLCLWDIFSSVSNSNYIRWIMVASPTFCRLGGEKKEIKIRRKMLTGKREVSSISSLQGGQEKLLVPFSIPSCWWRK